MFMLLYKYYYRYSLLNFFILGKVQLHKIDTTNPFSIKKEEIRRIKEIKGGGKTKTERTRNLRRYTSKLIFRLVFISIFLKVNTKDYFGKYGATHLADWAKNGLF